MWAVSLLKHISARKPLSCSTLLPYLLIYLYLSYWMCVPFIPLGAQTVGRWGLGIAENLRYWQMLKDCHSLSRSFCVPRLFAALSSLKTCHNYLKKTFFLLDFPVLLVTP